MKHPFKISMSTRVKWHFHSLMTLYSTSSMSNLLRISSSVVNTTMMAKVPPAGPVHNSSLIGYSSIYPSRRDTSACNGANGIPQLHSTLLNGHAEANGKVSSQFKSSFAKHSRFKHGRYMSGKSSFAFVYRVSLNKHVS